MKHTTLHYYPPQGANEDFPIETWGSDLVFIYQKARCERPPVTVCSRNVTQRLKVGAMGAVPQGTQATVSFAIKSNRVQIASGPEPVRRQLNGNPQTSPDCQGSFTLP